MERLTERIHSRYIKIKGCAKWYYDNPRKGANLSNAIARLAEYEDTELTPEVIESLKARAFLGLLESPEVKEYDGSALDKADQYIEELEVELATVKAERDAALRDLAVAAPYDFCKNKSEENCIICEEDGMPDCDYCEKWIWRGVQK